MNEIIINCNRAIHYRAVTRRNTTAESSIETPATIDFNFNTILTATYNNYYKSFIITHTLIKHFLQQCIYLDVALQSKTVKAASLVAITMPLSITTNLTSATTYE